MIAVNQKNILKSIRRAKRACVVGWVSFVVSLLVCLVLTFGFWAYSTLPETIEGVLDDGEYGFISLDMIDPMIWEFFSGISQMLLWVAGGFLLVALLFWFIWFYTFIENRLSRRMSPMASCLASLVPGFGIAFHYFVLKDALTVLNFELANCEIERSAALHSKFFIWFYNALAALIFCSVPIFDYWIGVLFSEFVLFCAFYRYLRLIAAVSHEEEKLLNVCHE